MEIKTAVDRLPGGLMLLPPLLGAICRTFAPAVQTATVLVTICIILTSIPVPILAGLRYRRFDRGVAELDRPVEPPIARATPAG